MSPIKGLTEVTRMPRIGKMHLGIKVTNKNGVEYPKAVDYFVFPEGDAPGAEHRDQLVAVYGEKPKELEIVFPMNDPDIVASQFYRCYQRTRGLVCRGDGEEATRLVDMDTGGLPSKDTKKTERREMLCAGRECPDYVGKAGCRELMNLQFKLPKISGLGIWQIDTGSINSIRNINGCLDLVRQVYGRIDMVLLKLTMEPITVTPEGGQSKTVHVLNIRSEANMIEATIASRQSVYEMLVGKPDPIQAQRDIDELWESGGTPLLTEAETDERLTPEEIDIAQAEAEENVTIVEVEEEENNEPEPLSEAVESKSSEVEELFDGSVEENPESRGFIDQGWLDEVLTQLRASGKPQYSNQSILKFLVDTYKVEGDTIAKAVDNLNQKDAGEFTERVRSAVEKVGV